MHTIRPIKLTDIPTVATLHQQSLPTTTSSKIGREYLSLLYHALLSGPDNMLLCIEEKGSIVGVITATPDLAQTSSLITRALYPRAIPYFIRAMLKRHISFQYIMAQMVFERALLAHFPSPYPTILTLFVDKGVQGKGLGRTLVDAVKKDFKKHAATSLYVDTLHSNTASQRFYIAIGGKEVAQIENAIIYRFSLSQT